MRPAVTRLQQLDLKVDTPTREPSDDVEEGEGDLQRSRGGDQKSAREIPCVW